MGFYCRDCGICIPKFLNDELDYKENSIEQLQYLKSFIKHNKIKTFEKFSKHFY